MSGPLETIAILLVERIPIMKFLIEHPDHYPNTLLLAYCEGRRPRSECVRYFDEIANVIRDGLGERHIGCSLGADQFWLFSARIGGIHNVKGASN